MAKISVKLLSSSKPRVKCKDESVTLFCRSLFLEHLQISKNICLWLSSSSHVWSHLLRCQILYSKWSNIWQTQFHLLFMFVPVWMWMSLCDGALYAGPSQSPSWPVGQFLGLHLHCLVLTNQMITIAIWDCVYRSNCDLFIRFSLYHGEIWEKCKPHSAWLEGF